MSSFITNSSKTSNSDSPNFYADEVPVADLVYSFDWSSTPLGPMEEWDPSFKMAVDICLHSVFPIAIYCGNLKNLKFHLVCRSILKNKHPALGLPAKEIWTEIFDIIGPQFNEVISTSKGRFNNDMLLFLKREGYLEECYFSFTFSPIFDKHGTVCGVLNAVQETTQRVLAARRLKTLSAVGNRTTGAKSMESTCFRVMAAFQENDADLKFGMFYLIERKKPKSDCIQKSAKLIATTFDENLFPVENEDGEFTFIEGHSTRNFPDYLLDTKKIVKFDRPSLFNSDIGDGSNDNNKDTTNPQRSWPLNEVLESGTHVLVTLKNDSKAILLPVYTSFDGKNAITAILICGINPRRALDQDHVSLSLTHGRSIEEERKQAEILADLNRQKIMFFQNISHELRTPLTLMLSPLDEAISSCPEDSPILSYLQLINRNARRLLKLVNILLQFSRIEAGKLDARFIETEIAKLTLDLASSFESMAKSLNLDYILDIPDQKTLDNQLTKKVFIDRDMYEKIVFNLCSNAFKHTWNGSVTVRVGIPESDKPKLFQRFYRVESRQSRSHEGTGIGLALVKELVIRHGGDILVESKVDVGSTFKVLIPTGWDHLPQKQIYFKGDEEEEDGNALFFIKNENNYDNNFKKLFTEKDLYLEESHQWIQKPQSFDKKENIKSYNKFDPSNCLDSNNNNHIFNNSIDVNIDLEDKEMSNKYKYLLAFDDDSLKLYEKYKVLVVDDNNDMSKLFDVYTACDGFDALRTMESLPRLPDLVLSDIMMPNMNGYELLQTLRSNITTQSIPIILLSAKAGEDASIEGLEKGADDYLTKPFSARELVARVKVNIQLSFLRQQLILQQRRQIETKQLLFSISSKIRANISIKETLTTAIEEIHRVLPCDRIYVVSAENQKYDNSIITAYAATNPNEKNLTGHIVRYVVEEELNKLLKLNETDPTPEIEAALKSLKSIEEFMKTKNDNNSDLEATVFKDYYSAIVDFNVSIINVPIRVKNYIWGWLIANKASNSNWSNSERLFLQQITNQIGLAIIHAELLEEKLKREAQMEAAKAANEAKSQILANTSHELRTPLGAIIGVLSAFDDTKLTEDQKDMIQIMTRASDVVLSVVNDILDAAKLEAQKVTLMNRTFDLFDLIQKTIEIFGERAGNKKIELILSCDPASLPKYVKSDPERLQQILMNLLSNSIKFTEHGEIVLSVSITTSEKNSEETSENNDSTNNKKGILLVEIKDTGIGIESSFMKDIWESFSQGDPSLTRRQDGTGLGLSICKHLVTINGGTLNVQSELGKGSKFCNPINSNDNMVSFVLQPTVRLKRVLIVDPVENSRISLVKLISESVERIDAFECSQKGTIAAKEWQEKNKDLLYDIVFFNVRDENIEEVKQSSRELRRVCGDNLCIILMVFWSVNGRLLGQKMVEEIRGHVAALCKPIMQKRLLDCLHNTEIFKSKSPSPPYTNNNDDINNGDYDRHNNHYHYHSIRNFSPMKPLSDLKVEKYYHHNRPTKTITSGIEVDSTSIITNYDNDAMLIDKKSNLDDFEKSGDNPEFNCSMKSEKFNSKLKRSVDSESIYSLNNERSSKSRNRPTSKSKCVLCVEDNPINLKVIQHQLTKLGYQSLSATNGQEAVNLMKSECMDSPDDNVYDGESAGLSSDSDSNYNKISLILMDCAMPVMSGFDASKSIRAMEPPISQIPIIALTASAVQGTRDRCLEAGMNDYLTKPLKIGQLKEMLTQWLGED
nr:11465_t:CDS:10 [Entrophospora candida]